MKDVEDTVEHVSSQHPDCHIIVSSLLSRRDELDEQVNTVNESLEKIFSPKQNVTFVKHLNVKKDYLKDKKH